MLLNLVVGKLPRELQPKHGILDVPPVVRSDFVEKVTVGLITPHRAGIERFTERGMILTDGSELEVDVVVCCTGYLVSQTLSAL